MLRFLVIHEVAARTSSAPACCLVEGPEVCMQHDATVVIGV